MHGHVAALVPQLSRAVPAATQRSVIGYENGRGVLFVSPTGHQGKSVCTKIKYSHFNLFFFYLDFGRYLYENVRFINWSIIFVLWKRSHAALLVKFYIKVNCNY